MMKTLFVALVAMVSTGCVAQVRGLRVQEPFYTAPTGTRIALASIDVPSWLEEAAAKSGDARALLKEGVLGAFSGKQFQVSDQTQAGVFISIWPNSKPILQPTDTSVAEVNSPYPFGADGMAHAVGAPPITWKAEKAPEGFTIDAGSGRVQWTPSKLGSQEVVLVASNPLGETKYNFTVNVVAPGKTGKVTLSKVPAPSIPATCEFGATLPEKLPDSVDAPVLLGVQIVDWRVSIASGISSIDRRVMGDVVYSLWTRRGKMIDTTRVRMDQQALASFRNTPVFIPDRKSDQLLWTNAERLPVEFAPFDQKLVRGVAVMSATAFAWPYVEHSLTFSVQLDESSPLLKPGITLSNQKQYEEAYKEFEKVAGTNPQLAGAHYNMGVMRETQGHDSEAAALYRKALALQKDGMYQRQLDAVERRLKLYQAIELEAPK